MYAECMLNVDVPIPIPPINGGIKPCLKAMLGPRDPFHGLRWWNGYMGSLVPASWEPWFIGESKFPNESMLWPYQRLALLIWNDWRSCWSTKCPITFKKSQGDIKEHIESTTYLQLQASWNVLEIQGIYSCWGSMGCWMRRLVDWSDILACFISEYVRLCMSIWANHPGTGLLFWQVPKKWSRENPAIFDRARKAKTRPMGLQTWQVGMIPSGHQTWHWIILQRTDPSNAAFLANHCHMLSPFCWSNLKQSATILVWFGWL